MHCGRMRNSICWIWIFNDMLYWMASTSCAAPVLGCQTLITLAEAEETRSSILLCDIFPFCQKNVISWMRFFLGTWILLTLLLHLTLIFFASLMPVSFPSNVTDINEGLQLSHISNTQAVIPCLHYYYISKEFGSVALKESWYQMFGWALLHEFLTVNLCCFFFVRIKGPVCNI